jgi:hypothetical protein
MLLWLSCVRLGDHLPASRRCGWRRYAVCRIKGPHLSRAKLDQIELYVCAFGALASVGFRLLAMAWRSGYRRPFLVGDGERAFSRGCRPSDYGSPGVVLVVLPVNQHPSPSRPTKTDTRLSWTRRGRCPRARSCSTVLARCLCSKNLNGFELLNGCSSQAAQRPPI